MPHLRGIRLGAPGTTAAELVVGSHLRAAATPTGSNRRVSQVFPPLLPQRNAGGKFRLKIVLPHKTVDAQSKTLKRLFWRITFYFFCNNILQFKKSNPFTIFPKKKN